MRHTVLRRQVSTDMVGRIDKTRLAAHVNLHTVIDRRAPVAEHQDGGGLVRLADQFDNCHARAGRIDVFDIHFIAQLREEAEQAFNGNGISTIERTFRA